MTYTHKLLNQRWILTTNATIGPHFQIRLGNCGRNGVNVLCFAKNDQYDLCQFLKAKGIELVDTIEDCKPENGYWWHFERFSHHTPIEKKDPHQKHTETMYYGGYTFAMGKAAYEIFKNTN
jgi:hypothetical protein